MRSANLFGAPKGAASVPSPSRALTLPYRKITILILRERIKVLGKRARRERHYAMRIRETNRLWISSKGRRGRKAEKEN